MHQFISQPDNYLTTPNHPMMNVDFAKLPKWDLRMVPDGEYAEENTTVSGIPDGYDPHVMRPTYSWVSDRYGYRWESGALRPNHPANLPYKVCPAKVLEAYTSRITHVNDREAFEQLTILDLHDSSLPTDLVDMIHSCLASPAVVQELRERNRELEELR